MKEVIFDKSFTFDAEDSPEGLKGVTASLRVEKGEPSEPDEDGQSNLDVDVYFKIDKTDPVTPEEVTYLEGWIKKAFEEAGCKGGTWQTTVTERTVSDE